MGQQETMKETGSSALRGIIMVLLGAALIAAMLAISAMPVMAKNTPGTGPPQDSGNNNGSSSLVIHGSKGACVIHAKGHGGTDTGGGC